MRVCKNKLKFLSSLIITVLLLQVFGCICDLHKRARLEGMLREQVEAQDSGEDGQDQFLSVCMDS